MNNHRLKQDSKAMEPPKKEIFFEEKTSQPYEK